MLESRWGEKAVGQPKKQVCLICGKPSAKKICDACADKLRGEALNRKKKEEKGKP